MRYVLLFLCLVVICTGTAAAQEEGAESPTFPIMPSTPSEEVRSRIDAYVLSSGASVTEHFPRMVAPRMCRQRDFFIPENSTHPRAGLILRIEDGECVTGRPYYVHNPETHRIWPITEAETIAILEAMMPPTIRAPE